MSFDKTQFRRDSSGVPSVVFSYAEFAKPSAVSFYKTYLGQALFYKCDVSKVGFSSVEWLLRDKPQKRMVFEEVVEFEFANDLRPKEESKDKRDYGLIEELYQQLKKNYDERKDYWTAGDFHYGELEMKRLHSKRANPLARWWHRNLGLVALYRWANQYGESYVRPLLWLIGVLLLFTFLFPLAGLEWNEAKAQSGAAGTIVHSTQAAKASELSYAKFAEYVKTYPGRKWLAEPAFFGHSLMTALSVAGFQKELRYEPSYPWGRVLALGELLLTSSLIALFLLAIRRQFRR